MARFRFGNPFLGDNRLVLSGSLVIGLVLLGGTALSQENPFAAGKWQSATGRSIFVSPNGGGDGASERSPTRFPTALARAAAGDQIILLPGSYGNLAVNRGGSETRPLFITARNPAVREISNGRVGLETLAKRSRVGAQMQVSASHLVIDGLEFHTAKYGIMVVGDRRELLFRNLYLDRLGAFGLTFEKGSQDTVGLVGSYLHSPTTDRSDNSGIRMDYGIAVWRGRNVHVRDNVFYGLFNHGVSFKQRVLDGVIAGNHFTGCGHTCIHGGQTYDHDGGDNTSGTLRIVGNRFTHASFNGGSADFSIAIRLQNVALAYIEANSFTNSWEFPIQTAYAFWGGDLEQKRRTVGHWGQTIGRLFIRNNRFNGGQLLLESRGSGSDLYVASGNSGKLTCRQTKFQAHGIPSRYLSSTIKRTVYPTVSGLACPRA